MSTNNCQTPSVHQNPNQPSSPNELILQFHTHSRSARISYEYTTPLGYDVGVNVDQCNQDSNVTIDVSYGDAYVTACKVCFSGIDHEKLTSDFIDMYLHGPYLQEIYQKFPDICIDPYEKMLLNDEEN